MSSSYCLFWWREQFYPASPYFSRLVWLSCSGSNFRMIFENAIIVNTIIGGSTLYSAAQACYAAFFAVQITQVLFHRFNFGLHCVISTRHIPEEWQQHRMIFCVKKHKLNNFVAIAIFIGELWYITPSLRCLAISLFFCSHLSNSRVKWSSRSPISFAPLRILSSFILSCSKAIAV